MRFHVRSLAQPGSRHLQGFGLPASGMTSLGEQFGVSTGLAKRLASRGDLTGFLMALCQSIGADSYMLVAVLHDQNRSDVRIVASNWIYDAIQLVGHQAIAAIAQSGYAAPPGTRPRPITTRGAPAVAGVLGREEVKLLDVLGHG